MGGLHLTEAVRAEEWWAYKLAPVFAVFYATALTLRIPVSSLWLAAITVLLSLVPGAAYVSVINDLTDRAEDLAAGKPNRMAGHSRAFAAFLVSITILAGLVFCFLWREDALLLASYLAAWLAFSLYSLPPFRWKTRGILGVLCDASGAHLFPTLVAVILAFREAHRPVNFVWLAAIAVWAFTNGVRGILWHQLTDLENDRLAGVRTFAARHPQAAARLGTHVIFPLELIALAVMLWMMHSLVPLLFLGAYAYLAAKRLRHWQMNAVIVVPKPRFLIVLHEYYDVYLPLAILIASALRYPLDWIVLAIHLVVFPTRVFQTVTALRKLASERRYPWR